MYAALTMGIVVTYQGTGVINFAAAAMTTVSLYVFSDLQAGNTTARASSLMMQPPSPGEAPFAADEDSLRREPISRCEVGTWKIEDQPRARSGAPRGAAKKGEV